MQIQVTGDAGIEDDGAAGSAIGREDRAAERTRPRVIQVSNMKNACRRNDRLLLCRGEPRCRNRQSRASRLCVFILEAGAAGSRRDEETRRMGQRNPTRIHKYARWRIAAQVEGQAAAGRRDRVAATVLQLDHDDRRLARDEGLCGRGEYQIGAGCQPVFQHFQPRPHAMAIAAGSGEPSLSKLLQPFG